MQQPVRPPLNLQKTDTFDKPITARRFNRLAQLKLFNRTHWPVYVPRDVYDLNSKAFD